MSNLKNKTVKKNPINIYCNIVKDTMHKHHNDDLNEVAEICTAIVMSGIVKGPGSFAFNLAFNIINEYTKKIIINKDTKNLNSN